MSSRTAILNAVRAAQEPTQGAPASSRLPAFHFEATASLDSFIATLELIGARCLRSTSLDAANSWLRENVPAASQIASTVPEISSHIDLQAISDPHQLDGIHTAVLPARFGVCENGAVWLDETELGPHRVLPMIAEHLFLIVRASDLVANMHQAYERVGKIGTGFGLFLAGPSKTADIEQCLVIGAHGARGATVFILDSDE